MSGSTYDFNDDDFERFVLGDPGGMGPGHFLVILIILFSVVLWWFK